MREGEKLWFEVGHRVNLTLHGGLSVQHDAMCWSIGASMRLICPQELLVRQKPPTLWVQEGGGGGGGDQSSSVIFSEEGLCHC